jgi:hypothetical protein
MGNPPRDDMSSQEAAALRPTAHAPRLVPAGETDDRPRQVPGSAERFGITVAGTAPEVRRLPFEPSPPDRSVDGTLVVPDARGLGDGLSNRRMSHYA